MVYHRILNIVLCATQCSTLFLNIVGQGSEPGQWASDWHQLGWRGSLGGVSPGSLGHLDITPPGSCWWQLWRWKLPHTSDWMRKDLFPSWTHRPPTKLSSFPTLQWTELSAGVLSQSPYLEVRSQSSQHPLHLRALLPPGPWESWRQ